MKRLLTVVIGVLFLLSGAGCGQDEQHRVREEHERYLADRGWDIHKALDADTFVLDIPDERLKNMEASGVTFLREYLGREVARYVYELKQREKDGERLRAILYEAEGGIIGGYGVLPNWTPGVFSLEDKERLVGNNTIKP